MSKRMSFSLIITLIIALVTTSLVQAADLPTSTATRPGSRIGQISSVEKDHFTLRNAKGKGKTILVGPATRFVKINGDEKSFKDLDFGLWVIAFGTINEHNELDARMVVIAGGRLNKSDWSGPRQYGRLLSVDEAAETIRVSTPSGVMNFSLDTRTHFPGRVKSLHALMAGMTAFLGYERKPGGVLVLKSLIAIP